MTTIKEIWKPVVGYEGLYEVSCLGNVRGLMFLTRYGTMSRRKTPRVCKQETTHDGYKRVALSRNKELRHFSVHRLVAAAFIPNPGNLPAVNHKNESPANNTIENLEWCTPQYNSNYGTLPQRIMERQTNSPAHSKEVIQFTKDWKELERFPSTSEAYRRTGIKCDNIQRAARKPATRTAGGYHWKYVNDYDNENN